LNPEETMKQRPILAALLAATLLAASGASLAAGPQQRYRAVVEPAPTEELQVVRSGGAWFTGVNAGGRHVTVVFQPRFATVLRDGKRVPVSYLRAGDRVAVTGRTEGQRIAAVAAVQLPAHTAAVQLTRTQGVAGCRAAGACASPVDCCTRAAGATRATCGESATVAARSTGADCCGTSQAADAAMKKAGCCVAPATTGAAKPSGCCR
jgi:hypothetical protein